MKVDRVQLVIAHQAKRVAAVAHGFHGPQGGTDATGKIMAGLRVDQVAEEQRLVPGGRDEAVAGLGVADALH